MARKLDNQLLGYVLGIIAPLLGVWIYYKILDFRMDFYTFIVKAKELGLWAKILSLGLLANLAVFMIAIGLKADRLARAILTMTFLYAVLVLFLKFFT